MRYVGVPDKLLAGWMEGKDLIISSDEGEAVGIAAGHWLATKERATVFMSADGFCNAMCPLTSYVIPEGIEMNFIISYGRTEPQHIIMTNALTNILEVLNYDAKRIHFELIKGK